MKNSAADRMMLTIFALFCLAPLAHCQGLEMYAAPHLYATCTTSTTRLLGMGGILSCIQDRGFSNPAFGGDIEHSYVAGQVSLTEFTGGLELRGLQFTAGTAIEPNTQGIQLTAFELDSHAGGLQSTSGPLRATIDEDDVAIQYGRRIDEHWLLGLGASPIFRTSTNLYHPTTGAQLGHIDSDSDFGFRFGAVHQFDARTTAGAIYDRYDDDVVAQGLMFGGMQAATFNCYTMTLGACHQFADRVLAGAEWREVVVKGAGVRTGDAGFRVGLEVTTPRAWAFRLGSNDGALSAGVGFARGRWSIDYAYADDWNDDLVGHFLGGSDTHELEVRYEW